MPVPFQELEEVKAKAKELEQVPHGSYRSALVWWQIAASMASEKLKGHLKKTLSHLGQNVTPMSLSYDWV